MSGELLFVYGTLRSTSSHPMAAFLARSARLVAAGACAGRLYSLGKYPGLSDPVEPDERVAGELWELALPAERALEVLDAYEGCAAEGGEAPLFERIRRSVVRADGAVVSAWVYRYARSVEGRERLA